MGPRTLLLRRWPRAHLYRSRLSAGFLSLILNIIALPPSPTSPSPTEAPLVKPMLPIAGLIMHRHVLRFHLPTLADTILRSHCISTYSNGPLNPPPNRRWELARFWRVSTRQPAKNIDWHVQVGV